MSRQPSTSRRRPPRSIPCPSPTSPVARKGRTAERRGSNPRQLFAQKLASSFPLHHGVVRPPPALRPAVVRVHRENRLELRVAAHVVVVGVRVEHGDRERGQLRPPPDRPEAHPGVEEQRALRVRGSARRSPPGPGTARRARRRRLRAVRRRTRSSRPQTARAPPSRAAVASRTRMRRVSPWSTPGGPPSRGPRR